MLVPNRCTTLLEQDARVLDVELVALVDATPVVGVVEDERENTEVDQILVVDASEATGDDHPETQIAGSDGGMLTARALPVIVPTQDGVSSLTANV